jgi:hypothetical protein
MVRIDSLPALHFDPIPENQPRPTDEKLLPSSSLRVINGGSKMNFRGIAGALIATSWLAPLVAAVVSLTAFFGALASFGALGVTGIGVASGIFVWAVLACLRLPVARPTAYLPSWELANMRIDELGIRLDRLQPKSHGNPAIGEAIADKEYLRSKEFLQPGPKWSKRTAYISMWQRIHHAEEALTSTLSRSELWETVQKVSLRLDGAPDDISSNLRNALDEVKSFLDEDRKQALSGKSAATSISTSIKTEDEALGRLRDILAAINSFRDQQWAGLVRLRNMTLAAVCVTELISFALLSLAVIRGIDIHLITAGLAYFLIAATVGFLGSLLTLNKANNAVEDYGLQFIRLMLVPVVSGIAGVLGVLLSSLLFSQGASSLFQAGSQGGSTASLPGISDVFNLSKNHAGIVFAMLFGYSPTLLTTRLDSLAKSYKAAIKSTEPGQHADQTS